LVPSLWDYSEMVNHSVGRPSRMKFEGIPWREYWNWSPCLSLLPSHFVVNSFALPCAPLSHVLCHHRPLVKGAKCPWTETSKTMNQNRPFLFLSWLSQVFCHINAKVTYRMWQKSFLKVADLSVTEIDIFLTYFYCFKIHISRLHIYIYI
jgi:hypothetical protein